MSDDVARRIGRQAADEIHSALHSSLFSFARADSLPLPVRARLPRIARALIDPMIKVPSERLGRMLARFDGRIPHVGLARAAREVLGQSGATLQIEGACPSTGAVLVVVNHPGAYDSFAMMAALRRDDVAILASDRTFLRAMPHLAKQHLIFLPDSNGSAAPPVNAIRHALRWLDDGKVLVQFGAGSIEPDARFVRTAVLQPPLLNEWSEGTGWLAGRAAQIGADVVPCFVSGVHSPRAKRLFFVRWAERRGITTIAPLVQATVPGFKDVAVSVRIGSAIDRATLREASSDLARTAIVRDATAALYETR